MHYMEDLKDLLCAELEEYAEKGKKSGKMSAADLDGIHKLTDTVKNIMKISVLEEEMEDGYSEAGNWMGEGRMYGTSYDGGMSYEGGSSYARGGGRGRGRNARRDSMGRYSREGRGGGYSQESGEGGGSYQRGGRGGNQGGGNRGGGRSSYAGGYSREGGYSRDGAKEYMMEQLEDMMEEAENPKQKEALHKCMQALERV